jgi:predicted nucleotide-binding protein (sugar kinase/HSP70/actin superfamily)
MRVGIPRAFDFFRYYTAINAFLEYLDVEVIVSPPSTRATFEAGLKYALPESCYPLKLFLGHVDALIGRVDAILVPSIQRFSAGSTNCAKLIGLPDLLRTTTLELPELITPDIDLSRGKRAILSLVWELGAQFSHNPARIRKAALAGWDTHLETIEAMKHGRLTPASFDTSPEPQPALNGDTLVALVGHPYNLYDPFVNFNLLERLDKMGVNVLTTERLAPDPSTSYWIYEYELLDAARVALQSQQISGIIAVAAFGCGPDGVIMEQIQNMANTSRKPLLPLILDEHSGEAGVLTRLEAFIDMLNWKKVAHGKTLSRH